MLDVLYNPKGPTHSSWRGWPNSQDVGLVHFAYRSDKEPAIIALIQEACARAGRRGVRVNSDVPVLEDGSTVAAGSMEEVVSTKPELDAAAGEYYEESQ